MAATCKSCCPITHQLVYSFRFDIKNVIYPFEKGNQHLRFHHGDHAAKSTNCELGDCSACNSWNYWCHCSCRSPSPCRSNASSLREEHQVGRGTSGFALRAHSGRKGSCAASGE